MPAKSPDRLSRIPAPIKLEDGRFGRAPEKETPMSNSSFRVYYSGSSGAVPFRWESQPGTPKHPCFEASLPPLSPPPSFYLSSNLNPNSMNRPCSKSNLLKTIFQKLSPKRTQNPNGSTISSFSLSSSSSSSSRSSRVPGAGKKPNAVVSRVRALSTSSIGRRMRLYLQAGPLRRNRAPAFHGKPRTLSEVAMAGRGKLRMYSRQFSDMDQPKVSSNSSVVNPINFTCLLPSKLCSCMAMAVPSLDFALA